MLFMHLHYFILIVNSPISNFHSVLISFDDVWYKVTLFLISISKCLLWTIISMMACHFEAGFLDHAYDVFIDYWSIQLQFVYCLL